MRLISIETDPKRALVGARIRAARLARQLTIKDVATSCGLTEGFISRLERDLTSPSVSTLVQICDSLSINVGDLFSRIETNHVRLETASRIAESAPGAVERLLTPRKENRLQAVHSILEPAASGNSADFTVLGSLHMMHVLAGSIELSIAEQTWVLETTDTLTFDGQRWHSWIADPEVGATVIWCYAPLSVD